MKTDDVIIGETYLCRVGSCLAQVVVMGRIGGTKVGTLRRGVDTFRVRRIGTDTDLPKYRPASALRPCPKTPTVVLTAPTVPNEPPTQENVPIEVLVAETNYLSALDCKVGWCTHCKTFRGFDVAPDAQDQECPDCRQHTLYGAERARSSKFFTFDTSNNPDGE